VWGPRWQPLPVEGLNSTTRAHQRAEQAANLSQWQQMPPPASRLCTQPGCPWQPARAAREQVRGELRLSWLRRLRRRAELAWLRAEQLLRVNCTARSARPMRAVAAAQPARAVVAQLGGYYKSGVLGWLVFAGGDWRHRSRGTGRHEGVKAELSERAASPGCRRGAAKPSKLRQSFGPRRPPRGSLRLSSRARPRAVNAVNAQPRRVRGGGAARPRGREVKAWPRRQLCALLAVSRSPRSLRLGESAVAMSSASSSAASFGPPARAKRALASGGRARAGERPRRRRGRGPHPSLRPAMPVVPRSLPPRTRAIAPSRRRASSSDAAREPRRARRRRREMRRRGR
jgi:hypothetical protein